MSETLIVAIAIVTTLAVAWPLSEGIARRFGADDDPGAA
ncbi:hypothetical protein A6F68_01334 [Tsuneonella dongtanensis]|uniref:Uncharacterized protein n=1 Tax=Tsuneonella dongtanensis TaxID=692370 RepID=A0A1B2ACM8_9SPHN|nr:hypothetical protein A6F68_01334 [Tsuneonella dongtanensis]